MVTTPTTPIDSSLCSSREECRLQRIVGDGANMTSDRMSSEQRPEASSCPRRLQEGPLNLLEEIFNQ